MKRAIIIRGVPGSGKTSYARELLAGKNGVIHSADDYCWENNVYTYDETRRAEINQKCLEAFCKSLEQDIETVICDNTNIIPYRYALFVEAAKNHGYSIVFATMDHPDPEIAAMRTKRKVSPNDIQRMIYDWRN